MQGENSFVLHRVVLIVSDLRMLHAQSSACCGKSFTLQTKPFFPNFREKQTLFIVYNVFFILLRLFLQKIENFLLHLVSVCSIMGTMFIASR